MRYHLLLLLLPAALLAGPIEYKVHFLGVDDSEALKTVKEVTFLTTLKKKKPISINALRFRAESDIPDILKAMHAHGYYDATAEVQVVEEADEIVVFVMIQAGTAYTIGKFTVVVYSEGSALDSLSVIPESVGVVIGETIQAVKILNAEQKTLTFLSEYGHPLAEITDRQMIADYETKKVSVFLKVEAGPLSRFGPTTILGNPHVKNSLFENKTAWKTGDLYDARLVEVTQKKLIDTALFSSLLISHDEILNAERELPMRIEVAETLHKRVHFGASWQTFFGFGLTFGWENRNVSELGRTLSLQADVTSRTHTGRATFFVPDFWQIEQDSVLQAEALQESILAYDQHSYSITERIERRIDTKYRVSLGLKLERLLVKNSVNNGAFTILEAPLYFRFSSADHLLDPTQGHTLVVKATPSINFSSMKRYYLHNTLIYSFYIPVDSSKFFVIANQIQLVSIWSSNLNSVPVPKRVLGGSDEDLRGYKYQSVSPRDGHKPIGGRFGLFYTFEGRFRITKSIGIVPFLDLAVIELSCFPKWDQKWYKSAGIGLRYFTFLGPIRFDVAFPLDRREGIDPRYGIIVSIGQTF